MQEFITGLGLSTSAGLNTYVPLIILNLAGRAGLLEMEGQTANTLTSTPALVVMILLLLVEVVADKIPVVDSTNDVISTAIRPVVGALLMNTSISGLENADAEWLTLLSLLSGGFSAGGVHAVKATARPVVTASTGGVGNPVVSTIEDISSVMMALIAIALPFIVLFFMMSFVVIIFWWIWETYRLGRLEQYGYRVR